MRNLGDRLPKTVAAVIVAAFALIVLLAGCGGKHGTTTLSPAQQSPALRTTQADPALDYYPDRVIVKLSRSAGAPTGFSTGGIQLPNSVLYQNRGPAIFARYIASVYGVTLDEEVYVRDVNWACFQADNAEDAARLLDELPHIYPQDVEYTEYDGRFELQFIPNDPRYPGDLWGMVKINAATAWDFGAGEGEKIAVIDSGIRYNGSTPDHEDLADNILNPPDNWPSETLDLVDNDNIPNDSNGHGTHVAGTAAAVGDNGKGVIGVAYKAKIIPIKIFGSDEQLFYSRAIAGITLATELGANVTNMSFMGSWQSRAMSEALSDSWANGVILVACAGNKALTKPWYPAGYPDVIAVGATDSDDRRSWFSNYGPWVDIAAPGSEILSTYWISGTSYWTMDGTSMSTPHVSGAAALIMAARPTLTNAQVRAVLEGSGAPLIPSDWNNDTIRRLDVGAACTFSLGTAPSASITYPGNGDTVSGTVTVTTDISDSDGSITKVIYYAGDYYLGMDTDAPYSVDWNTQQFPNTAFTLRAIAYDDQSQQATASITVNVSNSQLTPDYFNDFEGDNDGWWISDLSGPKSWHLTTLDKFSGAYSFHMGDILGTGYGLSEYDLLVSPVFDLSGIDHARVKFQHRYDFADQYDHGFVCVDTGDGEYHVLQTFSNHLVSWAQANLLLDDYLGKSVQLVFLFESDNTGNDYGWYVDDFRLVKSTQPPLVDLTSHNNGDVVSGTITVTATASDDVGISKVELYVNNTFVSSDPTPPYSFSLNTNNLHGGDNVLRVTAYDEFPLTASDSASVIVRNQQINSFSPWSAVAGTALSISGVRFVGLSGDTYNPATDKVYFTGVLGLVEAEVTNWSNIIIDCKVPEDAVIGPISVVVGNSASVSTATDFSIMPTITSIAPTEQVVGGEIAISGSGFLAAKGTSFVTFSGIESPDIVSWSNREITVKVPDRISPGLVKVTTSVGTSNGINFTPLPELTSLSSSHAYVNKIISLNGTSLGATQGTSKVYFHNNIEVPNFKILLWNQHQIILIVPPGVETGDVFAVVGGHETSHLPVTITLPPPFLQNLRQE
jgi:subtilisin family serine protease